MMRPEATRLIAFPRNEIADRYFEQQLEQAGFDDVSINRFGKKNG